MPTKKKGGPGKAEIKALEEEFLPTEEFDPRTEEAPSTVRKVYPGLAGRARPAKRNQADLPVVKAEDHDDLDVEDDDDEDPFDTTIVDKVLPVRAAIKSSDISVEDEHFDPTSTFHAGKEEVDPFDTTIAGQVIPELAEKEPEEPEKISEPTTPEQPEQPEEVVAAPPSPVKETVEEKPVRPEDQILPVKPKPVDEIARKYGRARPRKPLVKQLTDEEFDPRA